MSDSVFAQFTADDDQLAVALLVQPAINAALVHNRVPLVRHLTLVNRGTEPLADVTLTLELLGPDGPLTEPWTRTLTAPLRPGASTGWDDFRDVTPDRALLYRTDEAFPVDYRLTVQAGDEELRLVAPSRVLAHNEWFNSPALYDSLAAFVQPNTRAVEAVLRSAAQILLARSGSGSLQGYQDGSERAALIAGAVYEALRQLEITYQTLPASFENSGQKVRTTAAVLDGRLGNCLDLSVAYAACLEAAGLHPFIFISEGHAFGGFLLEEERLGSAAVTETNLLISMVDSGRAVPVELTRIGPGAQSATFTEAVRVGLGHFRGEGHRLQGVVDVHLAHRSGIQPLPSTDELVAPVDAQTSTETAGASLDLPPGVAAAKLRQLADEGDEVPQPSDGSPARVQQWRKSLLDLSLRNPLLNLPKRGRGLDLHVPAGALALLDDLIHDGRQVQIIPQDDISHVHELAGARRAQDLDAEMLTRELRTDRRVYGAVTEARYKTAMRSLQREARTMEQETGSNYLYLTIGTLVHTKTTGGEAYAPLFLLPVRIEGGSGRRPYAMVIDGTEVASPNYCLIEWLRVKHGVRIPELEQPVLDEHGIDIAKTLAAINTGLVDNRLNYRIDETASLRLLQFSTFQMWRDLGDHWPRFMENPVVRHLVESSGATFDDPARPDHDAGVAVDEAELHLPIPADGSQMQAIVMAERGQSFVLEGPPGTGKSQTITNMIARAVAAGRSVLFVAEKQAALEVVKRRLKQVGLGAFALDLHGRKQSLNAIRQQLRDALDQYDLASDGTWTAVETAYRTRLAPLVEYPAQVHTANPVGMSLWSAYEQALAYGDGPVAPVPVSYLHAPDEVRAQVERTLREFPAAARSARVRPEHPWALSGCRTLDGLHAAAVTEIAADLERLRADLAAHPHLLGLLRTLPAPETVTELQAGAWLAVRGMLPDRETTLRAGDRRWDEAVARLQADLAAFHQGFAGELATFRPDVYARPELTAWHTEAEEAAKKLFGKRKRRQAVVDKLAVYLVAGATLDVERVEVTTGRLVAAQAQAAALHQHAAALGGLHLPGWQPTNPDAQQRLAEAIEATRASRTLLARHPQAWDLFQRGVTDVDAALLDRVASRWRAWRGVLRSGEPELALWSAGSHWMDAWQRDGATWLHDLRTEELFPLRRWATVLTHADVLVSAGLTDYRDQLLRAEVNGQFAEEVYRRGVAAASLAERVRAGGLQYFDPELHDDEIAQFETAAGELRSALPERLPSVLVRRRPFSPTDRRGRFADFAAELRRKRGGRSFRELFEQYPDAVLALTPCVLVSPASAANFLAPGSQRFDLVIFDEASQIRVAEAIGAMGRGSAVVIVGDSRQMPPTSIMQASHVADDVDEGDGPVLEDLESILSEAVESGLPQRWLSWHYRSHDESLIAFSNRYYYDNKLSSLPSPGASSSAGITWRRVDGQYDRGGSRTNEVEARAILADITRRLHDPATATQSIGVVTFNIQQRDLILNLLEDSTDPIIREHLSGAVAEPIFVKNLENVQGDERDVVLFSLAFSTNPETGQLPLNFGPLSQAGGERRLNVAITRARRQVVLFSSFDPSDIDLSRTSAVGTQHLRAYCEMAAAGAERLGDLATDRAERRSRIRDDVAAALRDRGHEVRTSHGLSDFTVDLAVRRPGSDRWQVAVMLDGPEWSARPTVADRDLAPALLRTIMGWPEVVRFWLPSWIHDRSELLDRVDDAVARADAPEPAAPAEAVAPHGEVELPSPRAGEDVEQSGPVEDATTGQPHSVQDVVLSPLRVVEDAEPAPETLLAPVTGLATAAAPAPVVGAAPAAAGAIEVSPFVPYAPAPLGDQSDLDLLATDQRVRGLVREALREIIAVEGPVEQHRLARLALARFGFLRTREDRRLAVLALVDARRLYDHPTVGRYAWPEGMDPQRYRAYRVTQASNDRAFEEVPPEEVANAFVHVLQGVRSMDEERLLRAGLERLGYRRRTEKIDKLLRYGLHVALTSGRLRSDQEGRLTVG